MNHNSPVVQPMHRARLAAFAVLAALIGATAWLAAPAHAGPEPAPVPKRWQLDVKEGDLRLASVVVPGVGPRTYFYTTFTVINNTGVDLLFAPSVELATDEGKILRSGRDVPVEVTRTILDNLESPFLMDQIRVVGTLLQGKENAKDFLVVWPANDLKLEQIVVFAAGFSGETATVEVNKPGTTEKTKFTLRKTLEMKYRVPGELDPRSDEPLELQAKRWIMR